MNIITLKLKYQIDGSTSRIIEMIKNYYINFILYNFQRLFLDRYLFDDIF